MVNSFCHGKWGLGQVPMAQRTTDRPTGSWGFAPRRFAQKAPRWCVKMRESRRKHPQYVGISNTYVWNPTCTLPALSPQEDCMTDSETLTITDNRTQRSYTIPIYRGTVRAMDLRQIKTNPDDFGLMTYDPAFMNTASCQSAITYLDGDKGILRYRGYPIEQ